MDWNLLVKGKFYSSGIVYFDEQINQYKDDREQYGVATYDLNVMIGLDHNNNAIDNILILQYDKALSFLYSPERNFLLDKFNVAYNKCKDLCHGNVLNGFAMVSPKGTHIKYKNNSLFVYDISENGNEYHYFSDYVIDRNTDDVDIHVYYIFDGVTPNE